MTLGSFEEVEAGGVWEQMLAAAHERLAFAIADAQARRSAGLFTREDVSAWSVRALADGTVYAQHECGHRISASAREASDSLAVIVISASAHVCPVE